MKRTGILTVLLSMSVTVGFAQPQFTVMRHAPNWNPEARDGFCEVRVVVDNVAEVGLRGERVFVRTLQGAPARDAGTTCTAPLPRIGATNIRVRSMEGRGNAQLVEQPNPQNGYVAVIRIEDPQSGAAEYRFRIDWHAERASYFGPRDYDRDWDPSRWANRIEGGQNRPDERRYEGGAPQGGRWDRGWRSDRGNRTALSVASDGWGRIHADGRPGDRISRLSVRTEVDGDAFITIDGERGPFRLVGRVQSQDDRSLGVSLTQAMDRPSEGYVSIHFDANGNLMNASIEGNWGNEHFVGTFNRRYTNR
jgi:hypothetical protein